MKNVAALCCLASVLHAHAGAILTNDAYRVELKADNSVVLSIPGGEETFRPDFNVLYSPDAVSMTTAQGPEDCHLWVPYWKTPGGKKTANYFEIVPALNISATAATTTNNAIRWTFPSSSLFSLDAELTLPDKEGPRVTFTLRPLKPGYFSVGYAGAPIVSLANVDALWQPPIWQEKRFPVTSMLSMEHMCSLTATMLTVNSTTFGLVADPKDIPFRMPTTSNSRCGVLLRNEEGKPQPMFFAPVLGEADSKMAAGRIYTNSFRLVLRLGNIYEAFQNLSENLYNVDNVRHNTLCSLNTTIENMIALALDDNMSRWNSDLRGCDYSTDVTNTVKVVSALHPMSLAMITDSREIFDRRALPMLEYLLSREKFLFTTDPHQKGQGASAKMRGPTAEVFEWSSLFHFSQDRSTVLRQAAFQRAGQSRALNLNVVDADHKWVDDLALYRLTGEQHFLDESRRLADGYITKRIATPQTNFPSYAEFWTDFTPRWMQLFELYQDTGDKRYLTAAAFGAREYAAFCAMSPPVPPTDVTLHMKTYHPGVATVPAWRVSQVGLTPEAANTYFGNQAVFLTHYAPYFLRVASATDDTFLRDIARNAVVGRYANYPGYDINNEFSTVYESADYATTPPPQNKRYNEFYFNHIWPHIALLMDYLISDASVQSGGRIDFPSRYAQGYAYLQSKIYGDRPGTFYNDTNVWLYMPRGAVRSDNVEVNTISARGNGNFYVAFMNQSTNAITTKITITVPGMKNGATYRTRVWQENKPMPDGQVEHGEISITIAARGITAIAAEGLDPAVTFQDQVLSQTIPPNSDASHQEFTDSKIGKVSGSILTFGRDLTSAYIWLAADASTISQAKLIYRGAGKKWQEMTDAAFPFEFHVPLADAQSEFEFRIEAKFQTGVVTTSSHTLRR